MAWTRYILLVWIALVGIAGAEGQTRAEILQRITEGLNSGDPILRVVTLEEALKANDNTVRRLALSTAFSSSDPDLRAMALENALLRKSSLSLDFVSPASPDTKMALMDKSGGRITVTLLDYNPAEGTFRAVSDYTSAPQNPGSQYPGTVSGDRVSFEIQTMQLHNPSKCSVSVRLDASSPVMKGAASCGSGGSFDVYNVEIDLLR